MFKATELQVCVSRLMMLAVVIKTAILAIPHVDLQSIASCHWSYNFCGQQCSLESAVTSCASSVQDALLLRDIHHRFWETDLTWRDVFGF